MDAEVFVVERLFVADPYWKTPTPTGSTKRLGSEMVDKEVSGTYNKTWLWVGVMLKDWLFWSKILEAFIPNVLFTCACASTMCNTHWAINQNAVATFHDI